MKASVPLLIGCVALSCTLWAGASHAAPYLAGWMTAAAATGQNKAAPRSTDKQAESERLLANARRAIKQGDFNEAEKLISQAEALGVKYNPLTQRFVDTPEKLRKLLAEQRSKAPARPVSQTPSVAGAERHGGRSLQGGTIPSDPIRTAAQAAPQEIVNHAVEQLVYDGKSRSIMHLNDARAALARGDKLAALAAWQRAAGIGAAFGPNEMSPQSVADELIRAGIDASRLAPPNSNPSSPYTLRPTDIDASNDRLPQLAGGMNGMPATAGGGNVSPFQLPPETNPLTQSASPELPRAAYAPRSPIVDAPRSPIPDASGSPMGTAERAFPTVQGNGPPQSAFPLAPQNAAPQAAFSAAQRLPVGDANAKAEVLRLMAQARVALDKGDVRGAAQLAEQAEALNVPDESFGPGEIRPWQLVLEINRAMFRREGIAQAGGNPAAAAQQPQYPVVQGIYNPAADSSRTVVANSQLPALPPRAAGVGSTGTADTGPGQRLYEEGLTALQAGDRKGALAKFSDAWKFEGQFDPEMRQQLKDKLTFLRGATVSSGGGQPKVGATGDAASRANEQGQEPSPLEQVNSQQDLLRQKLSRELANEEKSADELADSDPKQALANMRKFRDRVTSAEIEPNAKKYLLTIVDRKVNELTTHIEQNKETIANAERNDAIQAEIVRDQEVKIQIQNKLAEMVEQFNTLMDEKRFPEAEVVARQARDIAPNEAVVVQMFEKARLATRIAEDLSLKEQSEQGFLDSIMSVGESAVPFDDRNPIVFDVKKWDQLTRSRARWLKQQVRLSPVEQEIQKSLSKPVEVKFMNRPLTEVMDTLGRMAGVNVYLDPQGLHAEGVTSDTQVTLNLTQPISLKSALNLVLSPLGLSYIIQDEVLRITSEQTRNSNTYARVYYVGDLVMPIPNFVPSYHLGLAGAIRESLNNLGVGQIPRSMSGPLTIAKNSEQSTTLPTSAEVLAQINQFGAANAGAPGASPMGRQPTINAGPGGLGGGVVADFDSLIQLITTTISPQSWDDVGGPGSVESFDTNLSVVVSQTQDVHEQIADLLEQLRRLQDLQVTIEVRFITLADTFFERIGVDFDFAIDDNTNLNTLRPALPVPATGPAGGGTRFFDDDTPSVSIGWSAAGPTADLDIPFNQDNFGSATPQFGGFDPGSGANFGFAILSDIEAFFLINAAQGDTRSNILQAPKVTLFNGQSALVADQTNRPFVTSVIPVVGDFAAAQMPVIVVLSEGTSMSVQAVVSADRRFVRLTLVPFFSQIGEVEEFTFQGKTTTDSGTTVQDPSNPDQNVTNGQTQTIEGTTVQLPTFAFTTVTTTVSVPDGGTVLLGGIKRLQEGRTERGVPVLSKLPWVSRLFKNVGIGRETRSLMMMVTPRIIIQEEEEEKLGIALPP